jgi:hypothetical protein
MDGMISQSYTQAMYPAQALPISQETARSIFGHRVSVLSWVCAPSRFRGVPLGCAFCLVERIGFETYHGLGIHA